jgi:hypothetical protein
VAALKRAVYEGGSKELEQGLALERDSGLRRGVGAARRAAPACPEARAAWQEGTTVDMTTDSS